MGFVDDVSAEGEVEGVESSKDEGKEGKRDRSRGWDDMDMDLPGGEGKFERMLWDRLERTER